MSRRPDSVRSILLVDGTAVDALLVQTVLEELDPELRVEVAGDGPTVLERLQIKPVPDLVLMSVQLPRMTGLEVLEALHQQQTTARIVVWSTSLPPGTPERALELGADVCLQKPSTYQELEDVLGDLLFPARHLDGREA